MFSFVISRFSAEHGKSFYIPSDKKNTREYSKQRNKIISCYLNFIYWYILGELSVVHTCICVCMHAHVDVLCVGQRPMPGVFFCCSPPQFLKQNLSVTPGLTGLSLSFTSHPVFYRGVGDPTSGSYLYSSEPFPYWAISTAPRRTSRKKRYGCLAHCTSFHAHVCLCA